MKERKVVYEPHPVTPERKKELMSQGFKIIDAVFAPPGNKASSGQPAAVEPADGLSDDELRAAIEAATGKKPHHAAKRETLIARLAEITEARQNETASNGLTRREIEADLIAMEVEFDQNDALDDLGALRDLEREKRNG
ncbi:hypothetical protein [Rhizobium sp. LC145]|uniref:hypothetical protein n=1 Tax=Rhizobium sp. LC145 TaxID=1120688 RepID=UPI00062A3AAC|nr:hypothetical protein [Rhizobium sp. LC145]KKX25301.1 hypothetical protein YH62_25470 [Rhizobium sp. LC145]TKT45323.1 hypothetical protein FDR95_25635 [Rhizobiaceae bacterium LC148]